LAPVANLKNIDVKVFHKIAPFWREIQFTAEMLGAYNLFGVNWFEEEAEIEFCNIFEGFCEGLVSAFADIDTEVDNFDKFPEFLSNFPSGTTFQDLTYFAQDILNDDFLQFNYGPRENERKYKSTKPPRIPLENIGIPIGIF